MQINTSCKDYDSISQPSHQSTRTTGPQKGRGANHDHAQGGRGRSNAGAYIYMAQPWAAPPPPPGMVMVPCPAPCGSGWGGCGWVGMLVDGVVVFANDVESYGICKELYLVRERRQTWKAHSLMMGLQRHATSLALYSYLDHTMAGGGSRPEDGTIYILLA